MPKKSFTSEQVKTLDQLLKLSEQSAQVIHAASQYIEYGPDDIDPHSDVPSETTKRQILSKRIGDLIAVVDHLVRDSVIDEVIVQHVRENKFWKLHAKWNP